MKRQFVFLLLFLILANFIVVYGNRSNITMIASQYGYNSMPDKQPCLSLTKKAPIPVAVTFTTSKDIGTTLLMTWTAFPDANLFAFQYRLPGGSWIGTPSYTNQVKLTNLTPNTYYECRIYIYKNGTLWNISVVGGFTTGSVSYTKALDIGTAVQVTWNNFAPWATNYTLQYKLIGTTNWFGVSSIPNYTKVTALVPNSDYECRVHVYIGNNLWGVAQIGTFHTGFMSLSKSQDMGTTLLMTWTSFTWASNYALQYRVLGATPWTSIASVPNQCKAINLIPDTDYEFRIAVYTNGTLWDYSAMDTVHTELVVFNIISDNVTSMQLGWNSFLPWATSYTLQYRLPLSTSWSNSANTTNTNVQISPVINGQDYFIRLKIFIGTTLWGISQEAKIGRTIPSKGNISDMEGLTLYNKTNVVVSPNPFSDQVKVELMPYDQAPFSWSIIDLAGNKIKSGNDFVLPESNTINISTAELPKGVYIISINSKEARRSFKIVKQ